MVEGLVSIIIPTYKRPGMLGRAIDSVLAQTYKKVEVIVIDDNNDGDKYRLETIDFMQAYADVANVKYIKHKKNKNGSAARNTGIQCSSGEYISFLDDDDYYLPNKLEEQLSLLKSIPNHYGGVCSNFIKKYKNNVYRISKNIGEYNSCFELLAGTVDFAAGSTLLVKKSVIDNIGFFDVSFARHQDWEFLIRFFRRYKLCIVDSIGVVISADGIRNNPNTDRLLQVKRHLFSLFDKDIKMLSPDCQRRLYNHQYQEIVYSYLRELKYSSAFRFSKKNRVSFSHKESVFALFVVFVGLFPKFMLLVYFILGIRNKRKVKNEFIF